MRSLTCTIPADSRPETKSGVSRKTGRPYSITEQGAFVTLPNGEKRRITLGLDDGDAGLPPGDYEPRDSAVFVGDFGALAISTKAKHWQPVKAASIGKAA